MGRKWQIGDPVDYTTDGWMDAQNWGHGSDDDDGENRGTGRDLPDPRIEEYGKRLGICIWISRRKKHFTTSTWHWI